MSSRFRRLFLLALPLLPVAASAAYNPAIVAADARWVVHADLNALRASALGKELVAAVEKAQSQATGGVIGIDVSKLLATVGALTAYGTNLVPDPAAIDGALIAQGTPDLRKIAESVLLQGTLAQPEVFAEVRDLPFPAYAISDPKSKAAEKTQVIVAFPPEPIVILSKSKARLVKARDVFRGAAPSLAQAPASPLTRLSARVTESFLFSASAVPTDPLFPQNAPQARILQLATSGALAIGERGGNTFAHAELQAASEDSAERLMKILQGMTALLSLAETNDRQLGEFLNSTEVSRDKTTVTLDLAYSSGRLAQMVQSLQTQAEAKPAVARQALITFGRPLAEWLASEVPAGGGDPNEVQWRTIENVALVNGSTVTVGRALNGGNTARFTQVEVIPAGGQGTPLVFRTEFMRALRGSMMQFQFPGADGTYTLKVGFVNDPTRKAKFAVSLSQPSDPKPEAAARGPLLPEPKSRK